MQITIRDDSGDVVLDAETDRLFVAYAKDEKWELFHRGSFPGINTTYFQLLAMQLLKKLGK